MLLRRLPKIRDLLPHQNAQIDAPTCMTQHVFVFVFALIIIPSLSKLVNCLSYILFLCKKVDRTFFVTVKSD